MVNVFDNTDSLDIQEEGLYQICFTKSEHVWNSEKMKISGMSIADALWLPSGITRTLQRNVPMLNINGVLSRERIINFMPAHLSNIIKISLAKNYHVVNVYSCPSPV